MKFFEPGYTTLLNKAINQLGGQRADLVEIDVLLTVMLQRLNEAGLTNKLVFKGGTMLRKMLFGRNGRLSTDLDFTVRDTNTIDPEGLILEVMGAFEQPYMGVTFKFNDKELGQTDNSMRASPLCFTENFKSGQLIKLEISRRADPILAPRERSLLPQPYFEDLSFKPAALPCLRLEEAIAEKLRAAFQRNKIRDLHDLEQLQSQHSRDFDRDLVRMLFVLKLWEAPESSATFAPFSKALFDERLAARAKGKEYNESDLKALLHRQHKFDLNSMIDQLAKTYGFLDGLSAIEKELVADQHQKSKKAYEEFRSSVREKYD